MQVPAVRIRRRCDTSTNFDYNRSHLTPSSAPAATLVAEADRNGVAGRLRAGLPRGIALAANDCPPAPDADLPECGNHVIGG